MSAKYDEEKVGTDCNTEKLFKLLAAVGGEQGKPLVGQRIADSHYDKSCVARYCCW